MVFWSVGYFYCHYSIVIQPGLGGGVFITPVGSDVITVTRYDVCSCYGSLSFLPASLLAPCLPWLQRTVCPVRFSKTTKPLGCNYEPARPDTLEPVPHEKRSH